MSLAIYNVNQYRDFPFKYKDRQYDITDLPRNWIVDAGITLPEEAAGLMPASWYLFRVSKTLDDVTVTFATTDYPNYLPQIKVTYPITQPELLGR